MTLEVNSKNYVETDNHIYFWGSVYSQWHKCKFSDEGIIFTSAEQYMMYHKAKTFNDTEIAMKILKSSDPSVQKKLGRSVRGYKEDIWNEKRLSVVAMGNYLKFSQNRDLKEEILGTGNKIFVEGSPYDRIWGVGLDCTDIRILDEKHWDGMNLLGKALMMAREKIRSEI